MLEVDVYRDEWVRASPVPVDMMDERGGKCILAFALLAAGVEERELLGVGSPGVLACDGEDFARLAPEAGALIAWAWCGGVRSRSNSNLAVRLMEINDDRQIVHEPEREKAIAECGEQAGFRFRFLDSRLVF